MAWYLKHNIIINDIVSCLIILNFVI